MQAQSRFAVSGGGSSSSSSVSADEHEAVIRELTRGHELTAQLRAEALRALRGQGQAEATAAFILQQVSRAFTICLTIMSSPARAPPRPPSPPEMAEPGVAPAVAARRNCRDDNVPRRKIVTYSPHSDGYLWRKYGQKRITNTSFPRCYFRCSYHRERNCPATKQVQQHSHDDPPQYVVIYVNEHTCDTPAWESEAPAGVAAGAANPLLDLAGLARQLDASRAGRMDERGVKEEHERQALVSSLACVLGGQTPTGGSSAVAVAQEPPPQPGRTRDAPAPASIVAHYSAVDDAPGGQLPPRLDDVDVGLDVMDYDVTGALCFDDSYELPDDGSPF